MDITEAMVFQHLYCPGARKYSRKEVKICDSCQRTKRSNKKYGKLSAKEAEEIPWNKLCVSIVSSYIIRINGRKDNLNLKAVTTIHPVTRWFERTQYDDTITISITKLVETKWLTRYPKSKDNNLFSRGQKSTN